MLPIVIFASAQQKVCLKQIIQNLPVNVYQFVTDLTNYIIFFYVACLSIFSMYLTIVLSKLIIMPIFFARYIIITAITFIILRTILKSLNYLIDYLQMHLFDKSKNILTLFKLVIACSSMLCTINIPINTLDVISHHNIIDMNFVRPFIYGNTIALFVLIEFELYRKKVALSFDKL